MKDETRFTPGPWSVFTSPDGETLIGIGEATGEGVFDCGFGVWRSGKEKMANARLIASAPDLYEACRMAANTFRKYEQLHRDKGTAEGTTKANSNMIIAQVCERALARVNGSPQAVQSGDDA